MTVTALTHTHMCWGNPGHERPFLPVEECWEWRKEEHSQVSFVSHLTSAPQNTNTESETRSRASSTSAGASLVRTVTHTDICNENIKRFPSCFAAVMVETVHQRLCSHSQMTMCQSSFSLNMSNPNHLTDKDEHRRNNK